MLKCGVSEIWQIHNGENHLQTTVRCPPFPPLDDPPKPSSTPIVQIFIQLGRTSRFPPFVVPVLLPSFSNATECTTSSPDFNYEALGNNNKELVHHHQYNHFGNEQVKDRSNRNSMAEAAVHCQKHANFEFEASIDS